MAIKSTTTSTVLSEQRHQMIAETAYYRAECRGFCGGDPQTDWLESEAEIDALFTQQSATHNAAAERETLLHRLDALLHEWDQKIQHFADLAKDTRTRLSAEVQEQIAALAENRSLARQKIAALRDRSVDTWYELREHTIHFFDEMHTAVDRVAARLAQTPKSDSERKETDAA